jgi:hypothetical protein
MSLGRLFSSLGRLLLAFGSGVPSLRRILLERCMDDAKLICLGALLRQPLVGILDQSLLARKRRPHATLVADKQ